MSLEQKKFPQNAETCVKGVLSLELGTLKKSNECSICGNAMERMIELPQFPLTEMYEPWAPEFIEGRGLVDQAFLFCGACSHGKLETIVPPAVLYGSGYRTRTQASGGALQAVQQFRHFIGRHVDLSQVDVVLDIGGNDGTLLASFDGVRGVAVDPTAESGIRAFIEDADLSPFKGDRKLIVSSHTLEHIEHPAAFFEKVGGVLHHGEYLALQFPSLEVMLADARIDHIHHQHIHYYSERSISKLMAAHGLEIVATQFDHLHYGALMVLARRGKGEVRGEALTDSHVHLAHGSFDMQITALDWITDGKPLVAFGAGLMVPVLYYHLWELCQVEFIADNDRSKDGLRYINFNKPIQSDYSLEGRDVVITGIATKMAARALVTEAFQKGARQVIVPVQAL